ncbi:MULTISPECIES: four helix bundle protein [unclassified Flavobacterium]|uniref:four helix bundle protein n=1 Tax=unclassified Flavobacterium TaxID=196869 RepID=UPI001F1317AC|nr:MULTISPECIES: four helix bundle protein [unclassified Flavobacterium]UMY66309.1 four helix bundle protein [Flavobacterium sp. HJ-32-4]
MGTIRSFEDMLSWQKARAFNKKIYDVSLSENFGRDFELGRQIRRASLSITSNIAEGFERRTDNEFLFFLNVAKGSIGEVRSQLYLASDLGYINKTQCDNLLAEATEISKMLAGFMKYLETKSGKR